MNALTEALIIQVQEPLSHRSTNSLLNGLFLMEHSWISDPVLSEHILIMITRFLNDPDCVILPQPLQSSPSETPSLLSLLSSSGLTWNTLPYVMKTTLWAKLQTELADDGKRRRSVSQFIRW
jgi:hypothetical protein